MVTLEHIEIGTWEKWVKPLALYQLSASGNHSAKINADVIFIYKVDFEDYKNCLK